jgi:PAS domain S-box-containing protein
MDNNILKPISFLAPEYLLSAIVESSEDAIVSKCLEGIVTSWNQGVERLLGYTAGEMVGEGLR